MRSHVGAASIPFSNPTSTNAIQRQGNGRLDSSRFAQDFQSKSKIVDDENNKWTKPCNAARNEQGRASKYCGSAVQPHYDSMCTTTCGQNTFLDSQMTCIEQQASFGSQNCNSQFDSQTSGLSEEATLSQHRAQSLPRGCNALRGRAEQRDIQHSRPMTPMSGRSEDNSRLLEKNSHSNEFRPPKAPTWNSTLIKRGASPVFEALRNMEASTVASSPRNAKSNPATSDSVVNLLRNSGTPNVESSIKELSLSVEGSINSIRLKLQDSQEMQIRCENSIQDFRKESELANDQFEKRLASVQEMQKSLMLDLSGVITSISDLKSILSNYMQQYPKDEENGVRTIESMERDEAQYVRGDDSFDIFQDFGNKAQAEADRRIGKIQQQVQAKRRRVFPRCEGAVDQLYKAVHDSMMQSQTAKQAV